MTKYNKLMIYIEMYLYRARKIIIDKYCTASDLDEAAMYLNVCKKLDDSNDTRFDVWFGKLELKRSKMSSDSLEYNQRLNSAKNSFFMSLSKSDNQAAHYGLYKIAVLESDYESAKEHLTKYEQKGRKNHYNFNLVHKMLDMCLGIDSNVGNKGTDFIFSERITYEPLLKNYQLAEQAFDEGNYNSCLKHLLVCQKLAILKNITVDFNPLVIMCYRLIEIKNVKVIDELKAKLLKEQNPGIRIIEIRKLIALTPNEIDLYFLLMDSYISLGVYACIPDILIEISNQNPSKNDIRRMAFYDNLAREQLQYKNIAIYDILNNGDISASQGDLEQAYQYYLGGLKNSGHSVFLSKLGDLFYANGYYTQAENYYLEYLKTGYEKKYTVYVNLYKMYRHLGDEERAKVISHEAFQELFLDTKGYDLEIWISQLEMEYNQEFSSDEDVCTKVKGIGALIS